MARTMLRLLLASFVAGALAAPAAPSPTKEIKGTHTHATTTTHVITIPTHPPPSGWHYCFRFPLGICYGDTPPPSDPYPIPLVITAKLAKTAAAKEPSSDNTPENHLGRRSWWKGPRANYLERQQNKATREQGLSWWNPFDGDVFPDDIWGPRWHPEDKKHWWNFFDGNIFKKRDVQNWRDEAWEEANEEVKELEEAEENDAWWDVMDGDIIPNDRDTEEHWYNPFDGDIFKREEYGWKDEAWEEMDEAVAELDELEENDAWWDPFDGDIIPNDRDTEEHWYNPFDGDIFKKRGDAQDWMAEWWAMHEEKLKAEEEEKQEWIDELWEKEDARIQALEDEEEGNSWWNPFDGDIIGTDWDTEEHSYNPFDETITPE